MSKKEKWTSHDGACTSCRSRKIRCGREKPQCSCCSRDEVECVYSSPPKRVNHIKILCQSFDDMQDRLMMMQGDLSWLTTTLKRSDVPDRLELEPHRDPSTDAPTSHTGEIATAAGHVVRDDGTQIERYYGPGTLVALCRDLEADLASHLPEDDVVRGLVHQMLRDSTRMETLDLWARPEQLDTAIHLPPRQLLTAMLENFLKDGDYNTDIFCRQTIYAAVERVYKEPSNPTSEPWALCFNLIILLSLGMEHPLHSEDPFVRPILDAAYATARRPSFFKSPRLVNVQALALFSLLAQQHHTINETLGDSIFAQACILAREAGLHQAGNTLALSSKLSAVDAEERRKVFKSLFIRDRYSATASGAFTWLPSGGPKGPPPTPLPLQGANQSGEIEIQLAPHWELAKIQDSLHRLLSSEDASEMSMSEWRAALARLQQKLESWTRTHKIPSSARPSTVDDISLHLAFLGVRIRMLTLEINNSGPTHQFSAQTLRDARLSCLLVATSCNHYPNQALADRLHHLLNQTEPASSTSSTTSSPTSASSPSCPTVYSATDAQQRSGSVTPPFINQDQFLAVAPLPLHRLVNVFPTAAVFILARHILGLDRDTLPPQSASTLESQAQHETVQDRSLLEALLFCFRSTQPPGTTAAEAVQGKAASNNYPSQLGRTIEHLVSIIHATTDHTGRCDTDDRDGDEIYAPGPVLASAYSLPPNHSSHAISMSNLNLHGGSSGSGVVSPSSFGMPASSSSLAQSTWFPQPDGMSSSATPLLTTGSSVYSPSPRPTVSSETYFDISQFLNQMDTSEPLVVWDDNPVGQAELAMEQQQQKQPAQFESETARKRPGKRQRTIDT